MSKRLARWKSQYLSLGGMLVMINSVLDARPTYLMFLFPLPSSVEERLDCLRSNFLWQGNNERKCIHLAKWENFNPFQKNKVVFESEI